MQALPGFRDFLPDDCAARNYIFARWREVARRYGFVEWDGPVLEPTDLYQRKSGPEIVAQLFNFTDKGEREVAMRPEMTPTLARLVAAHERAFKKPLRWFSIPQCFRYEKQQRGRLREHFQVNCDIVGDDSLGADIETIALSIDLLRAFGLGQSDFVVRISDREFWIDLLRQNQIPENHWDEILQTIDKSEREPREKTAEKLGSLAQPVFAILEGDGKSEKLERVVEGLRMRGLEGFAKVDLGIVRGLAYYTGIVFEIFDRAGKFRALAGGGRYDNLIAQLSDGAISLPAVGFAMGDVVLGDLIASHPSARAKRDAAIKDEQRIDLFIVIAKEERRGDALLQIQKLRERNYRVDFPFSAMKVPKQFQTAEQLGARMAILFGDEWPDVKVKTLATGEQVSMPHDQILKHVEQFLGAQAPSLE
jgi:histidyl-tRNA synthetase